jgi:solute carrier family 29 (equilibrative nucleoside transporter), member 1/2/3
VSVFLSRARERALCGTGAYWASMCFSYFSIAYNIASIAGLLGMLRWASRLRIGVRILTALVVTTVVFVLITSLVKVESISPEGYFALAMVCIVGSGVATGLYQNGMFALSAHFPPNYTGAVMTGQGVAGTVVSLAQILTLLAGDSSSGSGSGSGAGDNGELSALLYFSFAVLLLAACIVAYLFLQRLPFFRYYYVHPSSDTAPSGASGPAAATGSSNADASKDLLPTVDGDGDDGNADNEDDDGGFDPLNDMSYVQVLRHLWPTGAGVAYVFVVTLSLFPTFIAEVDPLTQDSSSRLFEPAFFVSFAFLLFNVSDLAGRWLAEYRLLLPPRWLWAFSLSRSVFFPLILLANVQLQGVATDLPLIVPNDALYFVVVLLFGFTNGYVASSCMIEGPRTLPAAHREKGGIVMINCLVWGLFLGSMLSFGLRAILCRCDPFSG